LQQLHTVGVLLRFECRQANHISLTFDVQHHLALQLGAGLVCKVSELDDRALLREGEEALLMVSSYMPLLDHETGIKKPLLGIILVASPILGVAGGGLPPARHVCQLRPLHEVHFLLLEKLTRHW
jgi:hypothetical protein